MFGFDLVLACPKPYFPDESVLNRARERGGSKITLTNDPKEAVKDADVVNTDVWASMGMENEAEERKKVFAPFQVNGELLKLAKEDVIVLHCLPAHRGEEISEDVLEGPRSAVWDQSENKMHMHKAILETLVSGNF